MKVALVHDRINKWGGAERILLALQKLFPQAPLYTSVYAPKDAPWAKTFTIHTSFLQHIPFAQRNHELFALLMPFAFEQFHFNEYDLVISLTSEAAKGVITGPKTKHICLCLTPTRYLWSGYSIYFQNLLLRFFAKPALWYLLKWEYVACKRPDIFLAISKEVRARIQKYYKRDASVISLPITLLPKAKEKLSEFEKNKQGYFLVVSRLVKYKRVDIAIQACNQLQLPLIVIGKGAQEKRLKQLAGPTVTFMHSLTDKELVGYYKGCAALIFPGEEDFGLTMLEAAQFGKPVIAYKSGGAKEIILEGKTGEFFYPQTEHALGKKLKLLVRQKRLVIWDAKQTIYANASLRRAKAFTQEKFEREIFKHIRAIM